MILLRTLAIGSLLVAISLGFSAEALADEGHASPEDRISRDRDTDQGTNRLRPSGESRQAPAKKSDRIAENRKHAHLTPVYKPPMRGAPKGRVGGGSRTLDGGPVLIAALAPDHVGLTTRAQPVLYWFAAKPVTQPLEFTLIEEEGIEPLLEVTLSPSNHSGISAIRVAEYGTKLELGKQYRWFVGLVRDPANRSRDILTGGMIERIESPRDLGEKLNEAPAENHPAVYAEAGLWYDAIDTVSGLIEQEPGNKIWRDHRKALLQQVGLVGVAPHDRAGARGRGDQ